ncbi:MAG: cupin domain-containing protein [Anaerolineae bacterium]
MDYQQFVFNTQTDVKRYRFPHSTNLLILDRAEAATSEAFLVVLEPDEKPPLHQHDDMEQVMYILQGNGMLYLGQVEPEFYPIQPTQLVRIPPKTWHVIHSDGQDRLTYLCVSCFVNGRPAAEPTWDEHVRVLCQKSGLDFASIRDE